MSFGDILHNQMDLDSDKGVIVDRDKYNDQRIINSLTRACPKCGVFATKACTPQNKYELGIHGEWIHVARERQNKK